MALVGDQERERAAASLREHYARGRLSVEELSDRLELALRARRSGELRRALAQLPSGRPDLATRGQAALDNAGRALKRAAVVAAVLTLWWAMSLALLVGFVATVVAHGVTLAAVALFPAVWLVCTLAAWRVVRRRPAQPQ